MGRPGVEGCGEVGSQLGAGQVPEVHSDWSESGLSDQCIKTRRMPFPPTRFSFPSSLPTSPTYPLTPHPPPPSPKIFFSGKRDFIVHYILHWLSRLWDFCCLVVWLRWLCIYIAGLSAPVEGILSTLTHLPTFPHPPHYKPTRPRHFSCPMYNPEKYY